MMKSKAIADAFIARAAVCLSLLMPFTASAEWTSSVVPEAQGQVINSNGGKQQKRFDNWPQDDYSAYLTHRYSDTTAPVKQTRVSLPKDLTGDAMRGKQLWDKSACINCHSLPQDKRWSGNMGPSLIDYGDRQVDAQRTYQIIYDPREVFPHTLMPPWGSSGLLSPQQIVDLVAYLNTLSARMNDWKDLQRDPVHRDIPPRYFGDNLDETRNPAVIFADAGLELWEETGSKGKSCATCHGDDLDKAMHGVATRYPHYVEKYKRVVSLEDMLSAHGSEAAGLELPLESNENVFLAARIKMASNGMTRDIDLDTPQHRAAIERGRKTFYKRIGQRNHACSDCHSMERAGHKWLGGRYIGRATVNDGLTSSYPAWRTSFGEVWSLRKRFQWCMLPHGANNLSADAEEYADLELYMVSFELNKKINVPGLKD